MFSNHLALNLNSKELEKRILAGEKNRTKSEKWEPMVTRTRELLTAQA
jgi:hypothetical protein